MPQLIVIVDGVEMKPVHLNNNRTTLGRRSGNDIVLDNIAVSGEHCVFELQGVSEVSIEDLGSTNGTHINGQKLASSRQHLQNNDVITIGHFSIRFLAGNEVVKCADQKSVVTRSLDALGLPGTSGALPAKLKILSGSSVGNEVPLIKAVTTYGQPGGAVVSFSHRRDGYYVSSLGGGTLPTLNGCELGLDAMPLAHDDVLSLAGTELLFVLETGDLALS